MVYNKYTNEVITQTLSETKAYLEKDRLDSDNDLLNTPYCIVSRMIMNDSYQLAFEN